METSPPLKFEDIRIDVPWGYVAGRWYGNRNVRPILALHGWQDNLGTWDRLIPLMPKHIGILCIDFPGHGRSSKYPIGVTYHVFDYVHTVMRVVKEYKWRKVSLMSHSMGASVAYNYAALFPHMVDMLVQIDLIKSRYQTADFDIKFMRTRAEKLVVENERLQDTHMNEPPSYAYHEMEAALFRGTGATVDKVNCKHLLNRAITNSRFYPQKFYFSRDARLKYYVDCPAEHGLGLEMVKRIRNKPYLLIRSAEHSFMSPIDEEIVEVLKSNNPKFEYHSVKGTHHCHLNNPDMVSQIINPFILKHRPMALDRWSLSDDVESAQKADLKSKL